MIPMLLSKDSAEPLNILCLGAHCDDIEIGCGATLLSILDDRPSVNVRWQVFASTPARKQEAVEGAKRICGGAESVEIEILDFEDGYLPYDGAAVKDAFEKTKGSFSPDLVFTHYRHDMNQDHRKVSELTWNTFRDHLILEYEIPKWDGDLRSPNTFVPVSRDAAQRKWQILQSVYESQKNKNWFTEELFLSLMRIRGMECNSASGLAEAFYAYKNVIDLRR